MAQDDESPLVSALKEHNVSAKVKDLDHYRIHGGMAVETDYIIAVSPVKQGSFDTFTLSKSYSAFRTFASQLKKASDVYTTVKEGGNLKLPQSAVKIAKYCELVSHLIESQKTQYLGKVNYMYVKVLAKQRSQLINDVLEATSSYFPEDLNCHPLAKDVASIIETFFLTDHCEAVPAPGESRHMKKASISSIDTDGNSKSPLGWLGFRSDSKLKTGDTTTPETVSVPSSSMRSSSIVVPMTRKNRRPDELRYQDKLELEEGGDEPKLLLDDDRRQPLLVPSYTRPVPTVRSGGSKIGTFIDNNPVAFMAIAVVAMYMIYRASLTTVSMDGDIALLVSFAAFCIGLHTPRPMVGGFDQPPTMKGSLREDLSGRRLLRRSMAVTPRQSMRQASVTINSLAAARIVAELDDEDEDEDEVLGSPLPMFPPGAKIGSVTNCWSEPDPGQFQVRGPKYLEDKKKVASGEFIFPTRGIDLFLTDTCPENVGSNASVFGGDLRSKPTFIINFRLPWGVLLFYFEIPEKFVPFVQACYEPDFDKSKLPSLDKMSPGERCAARFLMNDMDYKNGTLKIVPVVVDGPWVVRQVVGGKPAILGNKLPVNYVYQPAEGKKAMYLEADLDIAASSAARGILSVTRSYCSILTLDLGFVVQGNKPDELPECMLVGTRIHGVDPLTAPSLPPMKNLFLEPIDESDGDSVTPVSNVVMARE